MKNFRSYSANTTSPSEFYAQYRSFNAKQLENKAQHTKPSIHQETDKFELTPVIFHHTFYTSPLEPRLVRLTISNLPPRADYLYVRSLCTGFHIVGLDISIDNISGLCRGSAQMSVRTTPQELDNLKMNLVRAGLNICENPPAKSNGQEHLRAMYEQRPKSTTTSRPDLLTSDDLFGSSPGVGRTGQRASKREEKQNKALSDWNRLGQAQNSRKYKTIKMKLLY